MVEIIEKHINLKTRGLPIRIDVVQGTNAIPIKFTLTDYDIPVGAEARIYVRKPSNTEVYNNCTIDNNSVIVQPTTQMYAEVGRLKAQIQLIAGDGVAASFVFCIDVAENIASSSAVESSNEFGILDALINEAREAIAALGKLKPHAFTEPVQNLTTNVAGSALDATMGKKLQDGIDTLNSDLQKSSFYTQLTNEDLNDLKGRSTYIAHYYAIGGNSVLNKPPGVNGFGLYVERIAGGYWVQKLTPDSYKGTDTVFTRIFAGTTWTNWSVVQPTGLLSDLKMTNKNSVVDAVNEVLSRMQGEAFTLSLASGFTESYVSAKKKSDGTIIINFSLTGSGIANAHTLVATIPAGYRPSGQVYSAGHSGLNGPLQVMVDTDGTIKTWGTTAYAVARGTIVYTI